MSIDSDIEKYKRKIRNIEDAKPYIKAAVGNYEEAIEELKKIKGIPKCFEFQAAINTKIKELEDLITKMDKEISNYNAEIRYLRKLKAAEKTASEGGV